MTEVTDALVGSAFRYHPNGIIFNEPTEYNVIHSHKANVKKGQFYEIWRRNEKDISTLGTTDRAIHARKRRVLNTVFSEKSIRSAEYFILKHVDRWNDLLLDNVSQDWSEPQNMAHLSDYLVFDILGDLCFGRSFESKEKSDNPLKEIPDAIGNYAHVMYPVSHPSKQLKDFTNSCSQIAHSPILRTWVWLKPKGLDRLFEAISPRVVKFYLKFVASSVEERTTLEKKLQSSKCDEKDMRKDMFHYLFQAKDPETGEPSYSTDELNAEASLLIAAGSHTTSVTISGLFFYVTRNSRVYEVLTKEIRNTFASVDDISGGTKLSSCEYLRACIDEALRISPPGPSELTREVLPGGLEIHGSMLPEGTRVGSSFWSRHRNEEYFPDPNVYRPERWIVDEKMGVSAEDVARARSCFFPFASGPGNCVGKNLAMLELTITIARTLYRMDIRAVPNDALGSGSPALGWGRRDRNQYQLADAYISIRQGPMVQFKKIA